ncbi:flavin-containing monooxygenase [Rheinheimera fenheensis]|uniref:flavin-containing monooxygenase n=1 Tax=Rheinheimera fenheensis TaxID=3152295 RepID=UPI00325E3A09
MTFKACIIGAGPSGLAMAKAFRDAYIPYEQFDSHTEVGGLWDINRRNTPLYEAAHLISSKTKSSFSDFPMPSDYPDYPHHSQVFCYLKDYATHFDLYTNITFGVRVLKLEIKQGLRWLVHFSDNTAKLYDAVICATGAFWQPYIPEIANSFQGGNMHSIDYVSARKIQSDNIMVVGSGNSAIDIACELARHHSNVFLSIKDARHFVPKHMFGVPIDTLSSEHSLMPDWLKRITTNALLKICIGNLSKYGLPEPTHKLLHQPAIPNTEIFHHITHGRIKIQGEINKISGKEVLFFTGDRAHVETIVWATGFTGHQKLLEDFVNYKNSKNELYLGFISKRYQNLFCTNFFESDTGHFELFETMATTTAMLILRQNRTGENPHKESFVHSVLEHYSNEFSGVKSDQIGSRFYNSRKWRLCAKDFAKLLN